MDLSKIETLIEFVGRSSITELTVTEKDMTVRIFRDAATARVLKGNDEAAAPLSQQQPSETANHKVSAPIFGVLHVSPAPGDPPFVKLGDEVVEGQTLFIIEAMKVFNKIAAPRAGRIARLTEVNGAEVEVGDMLAEIA